MDKRPLGILYGMAGTGKTTLLRKMSSYQTFRLHEVKGMEFGFDIDPTQTFFETLKSFSQTDDKFEQLQFVWYCCAATANRFEQFEVQMLKEARKNYGIIVVLTMDITQNEEFQKDLESVLGPTIPVIRVLVANSKIAGTEIEAHGLDELAHATESMLIECGNYASNRASEYHLKMCSSLSEDIINSYSRVRVEEVYDSPTRVVKIRLLVKEMMSKLIYIYKLNDFDPSIFEHEIEVQISDYQRNLPNQLMSLIWNFTYSIGMTTRDFGESKVIHNIGLLMLNYFHQ